MKVAVIGGGPGGLATLKFLATAHHFFPIEPLEVRLFEAADRIGGTFVQRVYEDAELVSSKYLTAFSDFRLPASAPDFVTPEAYVAYLAAYAAAFGLGRRIECGARVERVSRDGAGGHVLRICRAAGDEALETWRCDAVAVCTGAHSIPHVPRVAGVERVPVVLHSSAFKRRAQFGRGAHVVVCGAGETAMDIAHLAVTAPTASVTLCHRDGFFCAPKTVPVPLRRGQTPPVGLNKPVDTSVASLFDTAYLHPLVQRGPLPWLVYDTWVKKMHLLISGTEEGPDQWVGRISEERRRLDSVFLCKSARALPYLSAGHRSEAPWNRRRAALLNVPIKDTGDRRIDVAPWPTAVDDDGCLVFSDDGSGTARPRVKPDVLVFATGYDARFPFLDGDYPVVGQADVRGIYKADDVGVAFIGFVRPSIGAIPPLAELQAQLWVLRLLQDRFPERVPRARDANAVAAYELDFKLHARGGRDVFASKRGVDHESYAYQLAVDMGAAPTLWYVATQGWRLFFTWAMGSNFNPKFRLVGPWKREAVAAEIMRGELYAVVRRSGGLFYLVTYTLIPFFVFGSMSIALHAVFGVAGLVADAYARFLRSIGHGAKGRNE